MSLMGQCEPIVQILHAHSGPIGGLANDFLQAAVGQLKFLGNGRVFTLWANIMWAHVVVPYGSPLCSWWANASKCFKYYCIQLAHVRIYAAFCHRPIRIYAFATEAGPMLLFLRHMAILHMGSTEYYDNVCYMGSVLLVEYLSLLPRTHIYQPPCLASSIPDDHGPRFSLLCFACSCLQLAIWWQTELPCLGHSLSLMFGTCLYFSLHIYYLCQKFYALATASGLPDTGSWLSWVSYFKLLPKPIPSLPFTHS
jgi:hypothetical protein